MQNAYGVEVTPELQREARSITLASELVRERYESLIERLGVPFGEDTASYALRDAHEDLVMDLGRFTDTEDGS